MEEDKTKKEHIKKTISIPFSRFYDRLFTGSVTIITGCGRSGTSILGKLVGSMDGVEYLFEPTTPKYMIMEPAVCRAILFEDLVLPSLQGRNVNVDPDTESYSGYYITDEDLKIKWANKRRIDVLPRIINNKPQFVLKLTEVQGLTGQLDVLFPGVKFIHIIRNGMEVIQSMMRPNWYTDSYMDTNAVDWVTCVKREDEKFYNVPWFVSVEMDEKEWLNYNHATRCAAVWRLTVEKMLEFSSNVHIMRYEKLCKYPEMEVKDLITFLNENRDTMVKISGLTERHEEGIRMWEKTQYGDIIEQIQEPEKERFISRMKKLGYM